MSGLFSLKFQIDTNIIEWFKLFRHLYYWDYTPVISNDYKVLVPMSIFQKT